MDEMEFRILDTLSRNPDRAVSINALTKEIRQLHDTAHYPNVYKTLHRLNEDGLVRLTKTGNSSLASLDLENRQAITALSEMELWKRRFLFERSAELRRLRDSVFDDLLIGPISLIDAEGNMKLNRAELLIQLPECPKKAEMTESLLKILGRLEGRLNLRIDALVLDKADFSSLLAARDRNQLKEMLSRQTSLMAPDIFWSNIRNAWARGIRIHFDQEETRPDKISEEHILHNLARFGYKELGARVRESLDIGIEYIVTALLLRGGPRRVSAIPVILAKNRTTYALLLFLAKKYGVQGRLLGILKAMEKQKTDQDLRNAIRMMEMTQVKEVKFDDARMKKLMRTYDALEA